MVRLRDLGQWSGGNTPSKANPAYWADGSIPWVSPKDMKVDEITSSEDHVSESALADGRVSLLPAGSVLVVTRSGILSHTLPVAVTKMPVTINQDLKALTPKQGVFPRYVAHALRGASRRILKECSKHGTTVASIETNALLDFEIPLVDLDEQRRIVAELEKQFSRVDEAVANLNRVKANLKRYKAVTLDDAVNGRLVAEGAASGDELPAGWRWSSIGDLATVGTGATPARTNDAFYRDGKIPWITSSAVNAPFVDAGEQFVTDEALRQTNLTLYPPGTLLLAMYGEGKTRGKCSELRVSATTNQALAALQAAPDVRPWLKIFLDQNYVQTRRIAAGGVQPNLNLRLIRAIRVPLPPADARRRIVGEVERRLSIVREVEAAVDASFHRGGAIRQSVLASLYQISSTLEASV
jgi:type I restriction enzyme S subunit